MQCACVKFPSVACPALQYFSTLSHKRHDFRKKKMLWNKRSVFWFTVRILSETFLILRRIERDMIKNVYTWYSRQILMKFNFLDRLSKNTQMSNLMKIRPVGADIDRRTDMMKLIADFAILRLRLKTVNITLCVLIFTATCSEAKGSSSA